MNHDSLEPDKNIFKEIGRKDYLQRARQRAKRRRSPWNFILPPLMLISVGLIWYVLFQFMWSVHVHFFPAHAGRFEQYWNEGIGARAFVSSFLLSIPLGIASVPLGLIVSNAVAWCIPPARRAFEREAETVKMNFKRIMLDLFKLALIIVPPCLLLSFIGAATLVNLR